MSNVENYTSIKRQCDEKVHRLTKRIMRIGVRFHVSLCWLVKGRDSRCAETRSTVRCQGSHALQLLQVQTMSNVHAHPIWSIGIHHSPLESKQCRVLCTTYLVRFVEIPQNCFMKHISQFRSELNIKVEESELAFLLFSVLRELWKFGQQSDASALWESSCNFKAFPTLPAKQIYFQFSAYLMLLAFVGVSLNVFVSRI